MDGNSRYYLNEDDIKYLQKMRRDAILHRSSVWASIFAWISLIVVIAFNIIGSSGNLNDPLTLVFLSVATLAWVPPVIAWAFTQASLFTTHEIDDKWNLLMKKCSPEALGQLQADPNCSFIRGLVGVYLFGNVVDGKDETNGFSVRNRRTHVSALTSYKLSADLIRSIGLVFENSSIKLKSHFLPRASLYVLTLIAVIGAPISTVRSAQKTAVDREELQQKLDEYDQIEYYVMTRRSISLQVAHGKINLYFNGNQDIYSIDYSSQYFSPEDSRDEWIEWVQEDLDTMHDLLDYLDLEMKSGDLLNDYSFELSDEFIEQFKEITAEEYKNEEIINVRRPPSDDVSVTEYSSDKYKSDGKEINIYITISFY